MTRLLSAAVFALALAPLAAAQEKKGEFKLSKDEQEIIDLTNAERKKAGLPALAVSPALMAAARAHAENMAKQEKSAHVLDGKGPPERAKDAGYKSGYVGENIAWNQQNPKQAVGDWMNSPGHRMNILKKEYEEIGVAVAKTKKGEPHWVQVFGKPPAK